MKIETRENLISLIPENGIAIELGVARGLFSEQILSLNNGIKKLYSVDRWAGDRGHTDIQYHDAVRRLNRFGSRSEIMKMSFDQASFQFDDNFFDFVYIDGYAHTGQENGATLRKWWPKLKIGGIFAGHDYHSRWPMNVEAIDDFAKEMKLELHFTGEEEVAKTCTYPSWYVFKS